MDDSYLAILRREFDAADGTFLLKLRCFADWDREAFTRLVGAMERCARDHAGQPNIETWVARGFWFVGQFVSDWSRHPGRVAPSDQAYYQAADVRLYELAYWLFFGESPYETDGPLPAL